MKEYIVTLQKEIQRVDQEAAEIAGRVTGLPYDKKREELSRQWALARGKVRGIEIALERLQDYLYTCQEALE